MQIRRCTLRVAALVLGLLALPALDVEAKPAACTDVMEGGDWATYGQDLQGTQNQEHETGIAPSNVETLERVWETSDTGYQSPPPIVAGGCVFINTAGGIVGFDLRTGEQVWESSGADTTGTFAVTIAKGRVHVGLNNDGMPKAAAFDLRTGDLLWTSEEVWFGYRTSQQSSAIVHDDIQVLFTTGPDFDPKARQGYALINAANGKILHAATTIPEADLADGYAGGGVWGTPTVDPQTDYLYVGTSNPESKTKEHAYDNAILKLDLDRDRPTFGQIVGSYKGTPDSVTGYDNPLCQTAGDTAWVNGGVYGSSPTCGQLDVDFGVGPTLWRDANGRLLGAATQKSGWLHIFDATDMTPAHTRQLFVGLSFLGGNLGRIATDGETVYVPANPGVIYALDATTFEEKWRTPLTGLPMKGGNIAVANGLLYYVDEPGLKAFDAATGEQRWMSPLTPGASIGSGVAVAGNHVVANHYGAIAAYRLPSTLTAATS